VENVTHSLLGAALAEVTMPRAASRPQRRLFFMAGVLAANLPDADLLYTRIVAPPLGYLLHHRGHTHTLVGCALLGALIWAVTQIVPSLKATVALSPRRFWILIAAALSSHLLADSWNSYGVHPFWPFDNRWFYGDAIFIAEPWFWVFLGSAAALNTRSTIGRRVLGAVLVLLPVAAVAVRFIPVAAFAALAIGGIALTASLMRLAPRARSAVALTLVVLFVAGMFGLHGHARAAAVTSLRGGGGKIMDVVLSPKAAQPFCWTAVSVERFDAAGEYVVRGGSLALFGGAGGGNCLPRDGRSFEIFNDATVGWDGAHHESLAGLRERARDDCYVRAWLQFGRVPELTDEVITDARYGNIGGGNFSEMPLRPLSESRSCPDFHTNWTMPRADLVSPNGAK
jgi:inner membrane protein